MTLSLFFISHHKKVVSQHLAIKYTYNFRYNVNETNNKGSDPMEIAICDDEKNIRELLANKIANQYPEANIFFYNSGEELLLSDEHIDILFLDIQMQGKNGMETARELRKKDKKIIIIFVTAVEEYVFQAFDVGAFQYIVKPINNTQFTEVLHRAIEEWNAKQPTNQEPEEKYLMINNGGVHIKVTIDDIVYAEVFNRKVVIHKLNETIEYYGKMSDLENVAGESFFRPHRAYLINFKYVEKYDATTIYLEKGTALMAKQKYPEFVKKYMKYNQRRG